MNLSEAFKRLELLDEDVFNLTKDGLEDLKDFEEESEEEADVIDIIDPDADSEEDLEDSYIGKVILDCEVCHTDIYKDKEDITIDEETQLANVGEECPYCFSNEGFKIIGEIKPFVETTFEADDDVEVKVDDEEVEDEDDEEIDESLQEDTVKQGKYWVNKGDEGTHGKFRTKKAADDQRKAMFARGYKAESLKESCSINQCQKWVDYDMKKYKKISDDTMEKIKSSGYSVVKDQYGDYEVIADRKVDEGIFSRHKNKSQKDQGGQRKDNSKKWFKEVIIDYYPYQAYFADNNGKELSIVFNNRDDAKDYARDLVNKGYEDVYGLLDESINEGIFDKFKKKSQKDQASHNKNSSEKWFKEVNISHYPYKAYFVDNNGKELSNVFTDEDDAKDYAQSLVSKGYKDVYGILKESIEDITIDTGDQEITVSAKDKEEVESEDEMIAPLSDEVKTEIEDQSDNTEDIDIDEFSEEEFDKLGESYLKKVYENVNNYKTTSAKIKGNKLYLEGLIKFNSGKTKKTSFIFESKTLDKNNKAKFIGENVQISRGHKSFKLTGMLNNNKFIAESLNYNYKAKDGSGNSKRVYGTVKVK